MKGWIKILLGVSLALNMLFIGLIGGKIFHGGRHGPPDGPPKDFLQSLAPERAAEIRTQFKEIRDQKRAGRREMRSYWEGVHTAMTADPFQRTDLEEALNSIADQRNSRRRVHNARLVEFVSSMSAEERKAYSKAMKEHWEKRRARWKKRDRH